MCNFKLNHKKWIFYALSLAKTNEFSAGMD